MVPGEVVAAQEDAWSLEERVERRPYNIPTTASENEGLSPEAILRRIARGVNGAGKRNAECVEMRKSGERERSTEKERGV